MLTRPDLFREATDEDEAEIELLYRLALEIRLRLPPFIQQEWPFRTDPYSPGCHQVAHAFARIAGATAIDGEHAVIVDIDPEVDGTEFKVNFATILHSWVEFETRSGLRFILDIFPDEGCPIMPLLYRAPNPAYWIPVDEERINALKVLSTEAFQTQVTTLEIIMRRAVS